ILKVNLIAQIHNHSIAFELEMRQQELSKAVKHLQVRIAIGNNLAEKTIELHITAQLVPEFLAFVVPFNGLEAINCRLKLPLHFGMVRRTLLLRWLVENLGKSFYLAPIVDLGQFKLVL